MRKLSDKPYGICQKDLLSVIKLHYSCCGIKGCKKFILRLHSCSGESVQKRRLSCIGIPHNSSGLQSSL